MRWAAVAILLLLGGVAATPAGLGADWVLVHPHDPDLGGEMRRLHFIDEQRGWAALTPPGRGNAFGVAWTEDGGATWRREETDIPYETASFVDPLSGWAIEPWRAGNEIVPVTADIEVLRSADGGSTWSPVRGRVVATSYIGDLPEAPAFRGRMLDLVAFADDRHG